MPKLLTNRAFADNVLRRRHTDYLHQVNPKDAEVLVSSLILRYKGIKLDRLTRICTVNGMPCPLTVREYKLLECLLLHLDEVWSREALVEQVWQRAKASINLVAVYVVSLRKKLGPGILRTVHGQGYTIDTEKSRRLTVVGRQQPVRTSSKVRL
jgi:DNA-binding response OmpR family regulator